MIFDPPSPCWLFFIRCLLGNWPLFPMNLWSFRIFFHCSISNKLWPPLKGRSKFQCQSLMPSSGWVTYLFFRLRSSASSLCRYYLLLSVVDSHIVFWDCHYVIRHSSGICQNCLRILVDRKAVKSCFFSVSLLASCSRTQMFCCFLWEKKRRGKEKKLHYLL